MNLMENAQQREANKTVSVVFNNNQHITLEQRKYTGLELKQAAIQQGVLIQLSYVLFILSPIGFLSKSPNAPNSAAFIEVVCAVSNIPYATCTRPKTCSLG